jgi:glycosyltransferase involved in cell wall biosynthesis
MTTLLMVTANHPFVHNGGETMFVAPELQQLVRAGWRIRLAPLHAQGERLPLPEGVELDLGLAESLQRGRLVDLLGAISWPGFAAEATRAWRHGGLVGMLRVWRWAAMARATWRWGVRLPSDERLLAYTYWRGGATLALARLMAERPGCAAVTRVHGYELYEERYRPPFQPWTAVYAHLCRVFTVSQHGHDYLCAHGVPADRVTVARLGTLPVAAARRSDDGVLRVLSCSFMEPVKRVPLLARAMSLLAQRRGAPVEWTHLGDGPDRAAVRREVAAAPSHLSVRLPGRVGHADVLEYYRREAVDVFVLVSASEGLPVSVQEALAAGVPVVATDVGGVREAVDARVGCLLPANPEATQVADAVAAVAAGPQGRLSDAAVRRWASEFDAARNHAAFARHLFDLPGSAAR